MADQTTPGESVHATRPEAVSGAPVYFSEHEGPGDRAALEAEFQAVIARERSARGLPAADAGGDGDPTAAAVREEEPKSATVVPIALVPPGASVEPPAHAKASPTPEAAAAMSASPGGIPLEWLHADGTVERSQLEVAAVEAHPHVPELWYVQGRWPTGQQAIWEVPTRTQWGRGTTIKLRWETGQGTGEWAAGLFQVESVSLLAGEAAMCLLHGLWPNGQRGSLALPVPGADWGERLVTDAPASSRSEED